MIGATGAVTTGIGLGIVNGGGVGAGGGVAGGVGGEVGGEPGGIGLVAFEMPTRSATSAEPTGDPRPVCVL